MFQEEFRDRDTEKEEFREPLFELTPYQTILVSNKHTHTCTHTHTYIHTYIYAYAFVYINIYMYIYTAQRRQIESVFYCN